MRVIRLDNVQILPGQNKISKTENENDFGTVEITILSPPWIRSFLSDILFWYGYTICN